MSLAMLVATLAPLSNFGLPGVGPSPVSADGCGGDTDLVVKLVDGVNIDDVNAQYGTQTVQSFTGTTIYLLTVAGETYGAGVKVDELLASGLVVWAEAGSIDASSSDFSLADIDQFSTAAMDQFTMATVDQFSTAALDQFSTAMLDQFSASILDQFGQAALDQFSTAVLDQFSTAALDQFSTSVLDQFSASILDQFSLIVADQFTQSAMDQFSTAALDQFSASILDQFSQAALDGFSRSAIEQFSIVMTDQFAAIVTSQFDQILLDQFSTSALDQFTAAILDHFSSSTLSQFTVANMDQFTQTALDQFSASILDQFTQTVLDHMALTALDSVSMAALTQFAQAALDQFSTAALDSLIQHALAAFDSAYFEQLMLDILDAIYGSKARNQTAMGKIKAAAAQQYSTGVGVVVAVIDTGIRDHWFLRDNIAPNGYDYIGLDPDPTDEYDGIDNDGDGLVDEGWSHGTHIAGIVNLVAPDAMIMPIRVQDSEGGGWSFMITEAIQYAVDNGADVINISLGVTCPSTVLDWGIAYAKSHNVVVTAAAGNDNSTNIHYPAQSKRVIGVSALDDQDFKASFSNYGADIDISAPGVNIYGPYGDGQFAWWSGTSQATPMISGAAALLLEVDPTLAAPSVRNILKNHADDIDALNPDYAGQLGGGRINLLSSVTVVID